MYCIEVSVFIHAIVLHARIVIMVWTILYEVAITVHKQHTGQRSVHIVPKDYYCWLAFFVFTHSMHIMQLGIALKGLFAISYCNSKLNKGFSKSPLVINTKPFILLQFVATFPWICTNWCMVLSKSLQLYVHHNPSLTCKLTVITKIFISP